MYIQKFLFEMVRSSVESVGSGFTQPVLEGTSKNSTENLWNYFNATHAERHSTPRAPLETISDGYIKYTNLKSICKI